MRRPIVFGSRRGVFPLGVTFAFLFFIAFMPGQASATIYSFTKDGNAFSSTIGNNYATASHCAPDTCGWIVGNQVIVGVYNSNYIQWGGSVTWSFNLSGVPLADATGATVTVRWPSSYGKGLHSPWQNTSGSVWVNGLIGSLGTNVAQCGTDYFAHPCSTYYVQFDVLPVSRLSQSTTLQIVAGSVAAWDVSTVELSVTATNRTAGPVTIEGGKIYVNGSEFLVKGACYAPWVQGTGPDPNLHEPFPGEHDDVTAQVASGGRVYVHDYDGDGRIQMWEVIQYDLEGMKAMGVNTIRTYASGEWHDKNMNGIVDRNSTSPERDEISQGDIPQWAMDRIVRFCEENRMMVIIGYWVQEEDFKDGNNATAGIQLYCDAGDLAVAKDTLRRIVARYSGSPAVLAWGIGNEVNGGWNSGWFAWAVDTNWYLNELFSYVKGIDNSTRPVMYSRYIGENANFGNLDADIMAPNAYLFSADELVTRGEFSTAPAGKAYMVGEFGHVIGQAGGHWNLSQQYAGGSLLEYNSVWWKGDGQQYLGAVDQYRDKSWGRYSVFYRLYKGRIPGDVNGDCAVNIVDLASVGKAYGTKPGDTRWNATADLDGNGKIGLSDLAAVGMYYGKAC